MRSVPAILLSVGLLSACQPAKSEIPVLKNARLSQLQMKYQGKNVWIYGGGPLRCALPHASTQELHFDLQTPLQVLKVDMLAEKKLVEIGTNGHYSARMTQHPIVLTFRTTAPLHPVSWSSGSGPPAPWVAYLVVPSCTEFKVAFLDEAHLSRTLSLTAPPEHVVRLLREWHKTTLGRTPLEMLWLQGPPDTPLTDVDGLLSAPTWTVMGAPGRGDYVLSFKNGRVASEVFPNNGP